MEEKDEVLKVAVGSAVTGGVTTASGLIGITAGLSAPLANLGGYATAQIIAGTIGVGGGPALATGIAAIGGPMVAASLATGGIALVVGVCGYGIYKLFKFQAKSKVA